MSVQPTHNLSRAELDRRSFLHPFTPLADHLENGPRVIVVRRSARIHWSATSAART
jgi:hypothetical protein